MPYSGQIKEVQIPDGTIWEIPSGGGGSVTPADQTPLMDGAGAVGTSPKYAREDHVHPSDTSKQDTLVSGTNIKTINGVSVLGNGDIATPNTMRDPATQNPLMDGTAAVGASMKYAREDHVHPTDTSRQEALVSGVNIKTINGIPVLGSGNIDTPDNYIKHLLDSSNATGLRQISSAPEDASYTVGDYATSLGYNTKASGQGSYAEGDSTRSLFNNTHTEGHNTEASNYNAHAEGGSTTASGSNSHSEGYGSTASGQQAHAEGSSTTALGNNSHAEGYLTTASNAEAHAEGTGSTASGSDSHAEGHYTRASGNSSHAQNYYTEAKALNSSASGYYTVAGGANQFVTGKYNIEDTNSDYAFIVGNGAANNARSNAYTLGWDGGIRLALDTSRTATASVDYALYEAILALGWQNNVID